MHNVTSLRVTDSGADVPGTSNDFGSQGLLVDFEKVRAMQALAEIMATAKVTVPAHLAGKPGDCLAVVMQAAQWGMNPFAVAQKTHVVNGALGYEAQLVNAVVQNTGAIDGRFHYEYRGESASIECRVGAVIRGEREITWGEWLSASSVTTKNSPLWKTDPKQQLGYLQVKNWARLYAPGAILGVYSADEIEGHKERDMGAADVVPEQSRTGALKSKLLAKQEPAITLQDVLQQISSAADKAGMAKAKASAAKLPEDEQGKAAEAYAARVAELKRAAQPVDKETGEIGQPTMTYAEVAAQLEQAASRDAFDLACDLIQCVPGAGMRDELGAIVKRRLKEFAE